MRARLGICISLAAAVVGCGNDSQQPFEAQVQTTRVLDTKIAWYERGQGPPLIMLMGTGSTMAEWDPALLRLLAQDHRLILFDYPGLGLSGPWRGDSFDSLADTTAGLMSAIDVPKADVLGWSMGGFVAQRLAIDHPEKVSHLILAGTNPGGSQAVLGTPKAQAIDSKPNPSDEDILRELYPPNRQAEGHRFLRRLVTASRSGEIPDDLHVPAATTNAQVAAEDPWLRSNRNYRQLPRIDAPTLVTAGRRDPVVPPLNLRRIAAQIPRSKLAVFPGAHAFLFQDRDSFARAVERQLGHTDLGITSPDPEPDPDPQPGPEPDAEAPKIEIRFPSPDDILKAGDEVGRPVRRFRSVKPSKARSSSGESRFASATSGFVS